MVRDDLLNVKNIDGRIYTFIGRFATRHEALYHIKYHKRTSALKHDRILYKDGYHVLWMRWK